MASVQLNCRIPEALAAKVRAEAERRRQPVGSLVSEALTMTFIRFSSASLLVLPLIVIPMTARAEISSEVHAKCVNARDYLGCIKAFTVTTNNSDGVTRIEIDQTNRPGLLSEVGNQCPVGYGYVGGGRCRSVICKGNGIFGKNEPELGGKGHSCSGGARALNQNIFFGRGTLAWGNDYINASYNPNCPNREMKVGDLRRLWKTQPNCGKMRS